MTRYQQRLSTARRAWRQAPGSARRARFVWRQKCFVATHTTFRLLIHEATGEPVAFIWD
jgi:hypothetical protein